MHETIGLIVYAHNAKEALAKRRKIMEQLACKECQHPFDYWAPEEIDGNPQLVSTPWATAKITELMDTTKKCFLRQLRTLRSMMGLTDEQIFLDNDFRFAAYKVGQYTGPDIYLYTDEGEGIREPGTLKDVLEKWPTLVSDTRKELDAAGDPWLVLVSVHY